MPGQPSHLQSGIASISLQSRSYLLIVTSLANLTEEVLAYLYFPQFAKSHSPDPTSYSVEKRRRYPKRGSQGTNRVRIRFGFRRPVR
jgi:hypothetical protein